MSHSVDIIDCRIVSAQAQLAEAVEYADCASAESRIVCLFVCLFSFLS